MHLYQVLLNLQNDFTLITLNNGKHDLMHCL